MNFIELHAGLYIDYGLISSEYLEKTVTEATGEREGLIEYNYIHNIERHFSRPHLPGDHGAGCAVSLHSFSSISLHAPDDRVDNNALALADIVHNAAAGGVFGGNLDLERY